MTARDSGGPLPPAGAVRIGAGPVATVSASALRANARLARGAVPGVDPLAFDAWGHGGRWVRDVLADGADDADPRMLSGDLLYGLDASCDGLRPVMRLSGRILATKPLLAGEGVSYGYTYRAEHDTRVALVAGGYAQGVVRALGNRAAVTVGASRLPIVGRVAMDVCVVDVGDARAARGDEAVFFGDPARGEPAITEWAAMLGWSGAELTATVGRRATREVAP
jgi:alanine racemase